MPHLPHSPLPYYAAAVVLWGLFSAYVVLIRIWRANRTNRKERRAAPMGEPQTIIGGQSRVTVENMNRFAQAMADLNKACSFTMESFTALTYKVRVMDIWLPQMSWDFPTWRVTRRPFDWRND